MKIFPKYNLITVTATFLISSQIFAAPPPGRETKIVVSRVVKGNHVEHVGIVSDKVTPWTTVAPIQEIFLGTHSQIQNADARFDYIIYPTSKFYGDLTETYLNLYKYNHADGYYIELNYPEGAASNDFSYPRRREFSSGFNPEEMTRRDQPHANRYEYASRYSLIENGIKTVIGNILDRRGSKVSIAVGSFYNPVYFGNEDAVAFYTLAAINEALQEHGSANTKVTILCDGNEKLRRSFESSYRKYMLAKKFAVQDAKAIEHNVLFQEKFHVESEVNRQLETDFFLQHMDRFIELGVYRAEGSRMSRHTMVQLILEGFGNSLAPQHVLDEVRETTKTMFEHANPLDPVRFRLKQIAKQKYPDEKAAQEATNKMMESLGADFSVSKIGIYSTILQSRTNDAVDIQKTIERVIKK